MRWNRSYDSVILERPSNSRAPTFWNSEELDLGENTLSPAEVSKLFHQCFGGNSDLEIRRGGSKRASSAPSKFLSGNRYRVFQLDHRAPLWWSTVDFARPQQQVAEGSLVRTGNESCNIQCTSIQTSGNCTRNGSDEAEEEWEVEVTPGQPQPGVDGHERSEQATYLNFGYDNSCTARYPKW